MEELQYNERESFKKWLQNPEIKLSFRTVKQYLYYYDKLGHSQNITNQQSVDDFISERRSCSRAAIKILIEYILDNKDKYSREFVSIIRDIIFKKQRGTAPRHFPELIPSDAIKDIYQQLDIRGRIMMELTVTCGLRCEELINFNIVTDLDKKNWEKDPTKHCKMTITGKGSKQRILFVNPELMKRMKDWWNNYAVRPYLSTNPKFKTFNCGNRRWQSIFQKAVDKSGVKKEYSLKKVSVHSLRHYFASKKLVDGFSPKQLQEMLGHSNLKTTSIYLHLNPLELQNKFNEIYKGDKSEIF